MALLTVSMYRQAITGGDNHTIDQPFLIAMFAVFIVLPMVILTMIGLAGFDVFYNHHEAQVGALGGGIAAVIGSVGAFVASVAVLLRQDRTAGAPSTTTTTTAAASTTTEVVKEKAPCSTSQGSSA